MEPRWVAVKLCGGDSNSNGTGNSNSNNDSSNNGSNNGSHSNNGDNINGNTDTTPKLPKKKKKAGNSLTSASETLNF